MKKDICVIIPIYKARFSQEEEQATINNCTCLSKVKIYFVAPDSLQCTYYKKRFPKIAMVRFPDKYFRSTESYSKLMLSIRFYQTFRNYKYMLICQPDVWILKKADALKELLDLGYDYIGAPWFPPMRIQFPSRKYTDWYFKEYELKVGNGGLSLRNIKRTIGVLRKYFLLKCIWNENEDLFFSFVGEVLYKKYRIPSSDEARKFSLEMKSREIVKKTGCIPFGVHAYEKYYSDLPAENIGRK